MDWRPANSAFAGGRSLPAVNAAQGKEWIGGRPTLLLPAAVLYRRSMLPRAKEWIGSSARAAYRRRSLPWARHSAFAGRRSLPRIERRPAGGGNSAFAGRRSLPRAMDWQGQRGGRRRLTANSAQGKGMDWRRSILLLPIPAGQLCPCRPAAVLCPGQGMEWQQQRKAREWAKAAQGSRIDGGGQLCPGQGKGMGSSAAAGGRQLCLCRPPFFAQGKGMAAVNPGNSAAQGKSIPTAVRGYYSRHCRPV